MKFKITTAFFLLACAMPVFSTENPAPEKCPSLSSVTISIDDIKGPDPTYGYYVDIFNSFDTKDTWEFFILVIPKQTREEAFQHAKRVLTEAEYLYGPSRGYEGNDDIYACEYSTNQHIIMAITSDYPASIHKWHLPLG